MKNFYYYVMVFLLFLTASCVSEQVETVEDRTSYNKEAVREYNGEDAVLEKIIQELKKGSNRESLERKLLKNEVLWKNAEYLVIEDKKRILIPFLSIDKENVIGFLTLYRDAENKIQYDMTVRRDVYTKNAKLPFWTPNIWAGYFMAYDRTILGKKNGNPGVMRKAIPKGKLNAINARTITTCYTYTTETCVTVGEDCYSDFGEGSACGGTSSTYCTYNYHSVCIDSEVSDPEVPPTDSNDGNDNSGGGGGNPLQIFNFLNGKANCIYQKLNVNSSNFINAIKKFDGEFPVSHLTFSVNNNLPNNVYGETSPPSNFNINIEMSNTQLAKISDIGGAISIAHEIIHAEIFRKLLSAASKGDLNINQYTTQESINFVNSLRNDFPGLYDYYYERYHPTWNHDMMAQHYRSTIADIVQQFDNNSHTRQFYEDLAWAGLTKLDVNINSIAWNKLTSTEQQRILQNLANNFYNGPSNCN